MWLQRGGGEGGRGPADDALTPAPSPTERGEGIDHARRSDDLAAGGAQPNQGPQAQRRRVVQKDVDGKAAPQANKAGDAGIKGGNQGEGGGIKTSS